MNPLTPGTRQWVTAFAEAVRNRDFKTGSKLFHPSILSFGTVTNRETNLQDLIDQQWQKVWPNTDSFAFDAPTLLEVRSPDGHLTLVTGLWTSNGIRQDGTTYPRRGRASLLLTPSADSPVGHLALHTHFSLSPSGSLQPS